MRLRQHSGQLKRASTSGYSLIELVVVIVLLSIIGAVSFFVVLESMRVYSRTLPRIDANYEANHVATRFMRDVRDIPSDESIQSFGESKLEFTDASGGAITYEYADGVLLRNSQPLAENLKGLAFAFQTVDGLPAVTGEDVHLVRMKLVAYSANESVPMALTVFPRGLQR